MLVPKPNRWHPVMLPDDYLRKLKQDLSEVEAQVEGKTRYEPDPDAPPSASISTMTKNILPALTDGNRGVPMPSATAAAPHQEG